MKKTKTLLVILTLTFLSTSCSSVKPKSSDNVLEEIFQQHWDWGLNEFPEWATYEGLYHNADQWSDNSQEAYDKRHLVYTKRLAELEHIHLDDLSPNNKLNYRLFKEQLQQSIDGYQFPSQYLVINQMWTFHTQASRLFQVMPKNSLNDFDMMIKRLSGIPEVLVTQKNLLQTGLEKSVTPPKVTLAGLGAQLRLFHEESLEKNPLTQHLFPLPVSFDQQTRNRLYQEIQNVFISSVLPAMISFSNFIENDYIPQARDSVGWSSLPQGEEWYRYLAKNHTTTTLTPEEIHQIGLDEVKRIKQEMQKVATEKAKFKDLKSYKNHLLTDSSYYFKTANELLIHYQALCKRIDGVVGTLFKTMPRTQYAVLAMPITQSATSPAALYMGGNLKTGRAGQFLVNTSNLKTRPIWESEALALHEALPGHHLQISIAQELEDVPEFRKRSRYTAYVEGWGLYAEALGLELGFYQTPSSDFGRLTFEMWRAVRLVVDTGLHSLGWSREKAISYFVTNSGRPAREAQIEIDRYIVRPGQALAYKIGEMKIWELRKKAREKLQDQFEIREFHDVVLGQGAVSLNVLEEIVDLWIESKTLLAASDSN